MLWITNQRDNYFLDPYIWLGKSTFLYRSQPWQREEGRKEGSDFVSGIAEPEIEMSSSALSRRTDGRAAGRTKAADVPGVPNETAETTITTTTVEKKKKKKKGRKARRFLPIQIELLPSFLKDVCHSHLLGGVPRQP